MAGLAPAVVARGVGSRSSPSRCRQSASRLQGTDALGDILLEPDDKQGVHPREDLLQALEGELGLSGEHAAEVPRVEARLFAELVPRAVAVIVSKACFFIAGGRFNT
jgi:hypothetical protein